MIFQFPSSLRAPVQNNRGFSLISLLFVILIISLAATAVFVVVTPSISALQSQVTVEKAKVLRAALINYKMSHGGASAGTLPAKLNDLVAAPAPDRCVIDNNSISPTYLSVQGWCGPYVDQVFCSDPNCKAFDNDFKTDGWGTEFQYAAASGILTSFGPDRAAGGGDDLVFSP